MKVDLKSSDSLFLSALNTLNDYVHIINTDYIVIYLNDACRKVYADLGFDSPAIGKKINEAFPFISEQTMQEYALVLREGKECITEDLTEIKGGKYFTKTIKKPLAVNGEVTGILTMVRDITNIRKVENAIKESEEKYRAAFYTSPDSVNINSMDGVYVDINDGFSKLTGYSREEVIGRKSGEINIWALPEDRIKLIKGLQEQGMVENLETVFRLKNGALKTGLMSARIIRINDEPHILSVTRDISERKKMESELVIAKNKAEENDRLKTAFLQNMSHEIRTPLNGILGFSELLSEPDLGSDKIGFYTKMISDSSLRLLSIVNNILDIARIETSQVELFEKETVLNDLLTNIYKFYAPKAEDQNVSFAIDPPLPSHDFTVIADEYLLRRVLDNLLNNAFKYTKKGSICFGFCLKDGELEFAVKDTGVGIAEEFHEKIFDRFSQIDYSLSRETGGVGLGLSICKGLLREVGGQIRVTSIIEKGSSFYFTIPYKPVNQSIAVADSLNDNESKSGNSKGSVLVVEDDNSNYSYYESVIEMHGLISRHAENGPDAINIIKSHQDIRLVLMDIKLPGMNGIEITRRIKDIRPDIPVIAQTAYATAVDENSAMEAGCEDFIAKPVNINTLSVLIREYVLNRL